MAEMRESRRIIASFPEFKNLPMYITEFNTSYNPFCPIHDTNYNAVLCAGLLAQLGDVAAGYSYWTFGDVFEEQGIPSRPFHGGFGLMANGLIPKPTLWAFAFFAGLQGEAAYRDDSALILKTADGGFDAVLWNLDGEEKRFDLTLPLSGRAAAMVERVDENCCNPLKCWHDMGEPADLTEAQLAFLRGAAQPARETLTPEDAEGGKRLSLTLGKNAVVHVRIVPVGEETSDFGYDYSYYCK